VKDEGKSDLGMAGNLQGGGPGSGMTQATDGGPGSFTQVFRVHSVD